jgi:hypothetical protein
MRDSRLAYHLARVVLHTLTTTAVDGSALAEGIAWGWADSSPGARKFSAWRRRTELANKYWMESRTEASTETLSQLVQFNLLDGRLLVDGKPLGQLPVEFTRSEMVKCLFAGRHLRVMPSPLRGMAYQLHITMNDT